MPNFVSWRAFGLSGASFDPTNAAFGMVTGKTNDVRNLQLSLRFVF